MTRFLVLGHLGKKATSHSNLPAIPASDCRPGVLISMAKLPLLNASRSAVICCGVGETRWRVVNPASSSSASTPSGPAKRVLVYSLFSTSPLLAHTLEKKTPWPKFPLMPNWFLSGRVSRLAASSTSSQVQSLVGSATPASLKSDLL